MPNFGALCGSRSLGSCVAEALVPLACPLQRLAPRDCWCLAVGGGEGGPVGGEGEGGRLGLFSSPLPGLFSSPHPGLFSPPPWYSRPDYRSDCWSRRWGDTHARRRYARPGGVGMGGRRAAAAVPPSPAFVVKTDNPREGWEDGTPPPHRDFKERECGASRRPPSGVYHFLSLFAVSHQFSQRPSCHLAFFPLSSFSLLLSLPLTHRSPRPRSETPLPSALLSLLLSPLCVTPPSSRHNLAPRVYRAPLAQGPHF